VLEKRRPIMSRTTDRIADTADFEAMAAACRVTQ
jgi:hypothetical protein